MISELKTHHSCSNCATVKWTEKEIGETFPIGFIFRRWNNRQSSQFRYICMYLLQYIYVTFPHAFKLFFNEFRVFASDSISKTVEKSNDRKTRRSKTTNKIYDFLYSKLLTPISVFSASKSFNGILWQNRMLQSLIYSNAWSKIRISYIVKWFTTIFGVHMIELNSSRMQNGNYCIAIFVDRLIEIAAAFNLENKKMRKRLVRWHEWIYILFVHRIEKSSWSCR